MKENNKLIAEFMGHKVNFGFKKDGVLFLGRHIHLDELKYHKCWNWIMTVVDKIEYIESITHGNQFQVIIREEEVSIYDKHTQTHIVYIPADGESKLTNTYKAVVEFIKDTTRDVKPKNQKDVLKK